MERRITFTRCLRSEGQLRSRTWLKRSKLVRRNGSKPKDRRSETFIGKKATAHSRLASQTLSRLRDIFAIRRNITAASPLRTSIVTFSNNTKFNLTNDMFGIKRQRCEIYQAPTARNNYDIFDLCRAFSARFIQSLRT